MYRLAIMLLLLTLAACGGQTPTASSLSAANLPTVGELLLAGPSLGQVATVGYLFIDEHGAVLTDALHMRDPPQPLDDLGLWLGDAPTLSNSTAIERSGATQYVIVEARGRLEGPGNFGPAGRYRYRLVDAELFSRVPQTTTIAQLVAEPEAYEGHAIRVRGELMSNADSALLIERIGAGGVPANNARQLKFATPPRDAATIPGMQSSADGRVMYGSVEVVGLWRDGRLYPLALIF
ncbi:MAG: hypothetical protein EI684_00085 [Candidatus Viridilinea halotolerans]|uniref:Phytase-like domain-containing protein n=1 Tax=Candidatus Viridilinea halotolerans TaxID=2491704 RepID=A0A426UCF8_9CHLR|nr:MAG: hypothetical protein EI684_00085 [Candidatus Viridilinea halotolerans]